jgi:predicted dehydrogenase
VTEARKLGVGLLGCGNIAPKYVRGLHVWDVLEVVSCADLDVSRAHALAREHDLSKSYGVEEMLADDDVDIVVDLTSHQAHAAVGLAVVSAGKHLYQEKPFTHTVGEGQTILDEARRRSVLVAGAPDGFLGGGLQTCRKLIDDGAIGEPVGAFTAYVQHHPDEWHPDAEGYHVAGGGPLHALGSYLITALVALLGPVTEAGATAIDAREERRIRVGPRAGTPFRVRAPTHVAGTLDFAGGATATVLASYELWATNLPELELYGTAGAIVGPHPDSYAGPVRLAAAPSTEWEDVPFSHSPDVMRGIGIADLAHAVLDGRAPRASGELALHVVDVLRALEESARTRTRLATTTTCERPPPLPPNATGVSL